MSRESIRTRLIFSIIFLLGGVSLLVMFVVITDNFANETAFAQQNLIRLHVLAHSNLPKDQDLKLLVRDAILAESKNILDKVSEKEEAHTLLADNKLKIQEVAQRVVTMQGFDYPVHVQIGNYPFPEKTYGSLCLPEGLYDAVRVEIGKAVGDNWWCVLFPPLCLADLEGTGANLISVNEESAENSFAFRSKLWDQIAQTRYVQNIQKWWQASAASYPSLAN